VGLDLDGGQYTRPEPLPSIFWGLICVLPSSVAVAVAVTVAVTGVMMFFVR
jgi:hypothetical protein